MTDNKGNSFVMHKLLTTKLPLALLLMQLARLLDRRRVRLDLIWTPRDKNALADALTNGDFTAFSEHLRQQVAFEDIDLSW
eukprot:4352583-Amphidinium_carterae.1